MWTESKITYFSECLHDSGQISQLSWVVSPRLLYMNGQGCLYYPLVIWRSSRYKQTTQCAWRWPSVPKELPCGNIRPYEESKVLILTLTPAIPAPCSYIGNTPFSVGPMYTVGRYFPTSIIILHPRPMEDKPTESVFSLNSCIHRRGWWA